ncbi:methylesterase 10 [Citrus sinensis]|uniref:Methylesterase 10 n=3 Tax=Citrus sinensis TaxID=2711 RepID=A0ACB8J2A6_CITSI|nr:methylesterase 10 [Citrus sinensis]KAH9711687.1 methylesterase 10 [Citrus sinensis]KAH9711695.1 methylesterase 10 [Citrus sinensis]
MEERKHFVLVHGACLGAWCWYKVLTLLKLAGHHVSAIDLGASGVNSKRLDDEIASISDYLQPLMEFMACLPQEKKYFNRTPVESLLDCQFTFNKGLENPPTSALFGAEYMKTALCKRCELEASHQDLELTKMLVRPTGFFVEDLSKESLLTKEKFGSVDRVYVICKEDEVMKEDFQRAMIEDYHPKQVVSISAAGHMVMLSKPEELCQILLEDIAHK